MRTAGVLLLASFTLAGTTYADADVVGTTAEPPPPVSPDDPTLHDPMPPEARGSRGLYFSGHYVRRVGVNGVIRTLRSAGLNAAVIDVKDDFGQILIETQVPLFQGSRHSFFGNGRALTDALHAAGIRAVARVVCFNDPLLPTRRLDLAVHDTRPNRANRPWVSWGTGSPWLDPSNPTIHAALRDLAVEIEAAGFDEIQLDYIRFPVDEGTRYAEFPALDPNRRRAEILRDFLADLDRSLHIPLGVDVFGIQALHSGDRAGLGQDLVLWSPYLEVVTPMLYLNGFKSWRTRDGGDRAMSFVLTATALARRRLGDRLVIRPFVQAFERGADHFDANFITTQIRASRIGGANGFLFWHPGSSYGMVTRALANPNGRATANTSTWTGIPTTSITQEPPTGEPSERLRARRARRARTANATLASAAQ